MNCTEIQASLSAYVEHEMADREAQQVRAHLEGCAGCRRIADDLQAMLATLRTMPSAPPPDDLVERIHRQLAAAAEPWWKVWRERASHWWAVRIPVGAMATAAVILLVVQVSRVTGPMMTTARISDVSTAIERRTIPGQYGQDRKRIVVAKDQEMARDERLGLKAKSAVVTAGGLGNALSKSEMPMVAARSPAAPARGSGTMAFSPAVGGVAEADKMVSVDRAKAEEAGLEVSSTPTVPQFLATAGDQAHRISVRVVNLTQAREVVERLLRQDLTTRGVENPTPTRFYLVLATDQFGVLMDRLPTVGVPNPIETLSQLPDEFPKTLAWAPSPVRRQDDRVPAPLQWVILELVPADPS